MCGRVLIVRWDELLDVIDTIKVGAPLNPYPDWPARMVQSDDQADENPITGESSITDAFPKSLVPIVRTQASDRELVPDKLIWGYEMRGKNNVVFNTRVETAAASPLWRNSFANRHCIVPVHAFYEPHRDERIINPKTGKERKQVFQFTQPDGQPILLAGIWEKDRFSILTTSPNEVVGQVHDRMPVMLDTPGAHEWLINGGLPDSSAGKTLLGRPLY